MSTYTGVLKNVTPSNAANSTLYTEVLSGSMPEDGPKLTTTELNAIKSWINSGAPNN